MKPLISTQNPKPSLLFYTASKLFNTPITLTDLRKYIFAFTFGLTIGIILCFSCNNYSLNLQVVKQISVPNIQVEVQVQNPITLQNSSTVITPTMPQNSSSRNKNNTPKEHKFEGFAAPGNLKHIMTDDELLRKASSAPKIREYPLGRVPKIAFMFLVRGPVLFAPLWEKFFKGHEGLFSIYVHSNPGFNASIPKNSVFYGRTIPSKEVQWGKVNMIEAERRLLANALLDFSNQRFALISESCIPLFNFSTVYSYLINSTQTFVESYDLNNHVGRGRYNSHMLPHISLKQWRKGAQWFEMDRELAHEVVSDRTYFPIFQRLCKGSCYADEHYLPTFVNTKFGEKKNSNRSLTWVDWSRGGAHPYTYRRQLVTVEFLKKIRSEKKCEYNGKSTNVCQLFARKFHINALDRLLRFAPKIMHFNP